MDSTRENDLYKMLVDANLAYESSIDYDGFKSVRVRTNEKAAAIALGVFRKFLGDMIGEILDLRNRHDSSQ
jgi:hypothetical protein